MTPIIFVSFLVSLAWVDFRNTVRRSHYHSQRPGRLPEWLHHIVYRRQKDRGARMDRTRNSADDDGGEWYYHSKQRKLMKMEVTDAFEVRTTVLVVLGLLAAASSWATWRAGLWALGFFYAD